MTCIDVCRPTPDVRRAPAAHRRYSYRGTVALFDDSTRPHDIKKATVVEATKKYERARVISIVTGSQKAKIEKDKAFEDMADATITPTDS
jgi:hypothetical protein